MTKLFFTIGLAGSFMLSAAASAATTLSVSACDTNGATYTFSTTEAEPAIIASNADGEEKLLVLSTASGTQTTDFGTSWSNPSNAALSLELVAGSETATASCP